MGRPRTVKDLQYYLDKAKAREAFRNARKVASPKAYKKRDPRDTVYLRNTFDNSATPASDPWYQTYVYSHVLTALGGAAIAGLSTSAPNGVTPSKLRGSGIKPSRYSWYYGNDTPESKVTEWGSRWVKFYDKSGNYSHFSTPAAKATGAFTVDDLYVQFEALFGNGGTKVALLGENGMAFFTPEKRTFTTKGSAR